MQSIFSPDSKITPALTGPELPDFAFSCGFPPGSQFRNTGEIPIFKAFLIGISRLPGTQAAAAADLFPPGLIAVNLYTLITRSPVWPVSCLSGTAFVICLLPKKVLALSRNG